MASIALFTQKKGGLSRRFRENWREGEIMMGKFVVKISGGNFAR